MRECTTDIFEVGAPKFRTKVESRTWLRFELVDGDGASGSMRHCDWMESCRAVNVKIVVSGLKL